MTVHQIRTALALTATLAATACTTMDTSPPPAKPQAVVNERVAMMKGFGAALGNVANYTQGKTTLTDAKAKLAPARANADRLAKMFPRGTALGDRGVTQSRALSIIFANRSDFERKADNLAAAFATLDAALANNDKAAAKSAVATARTACAQCHDKYRAPED